MRRKVVSPLRCLTDNDILMADVSKRRRVWGCIQISVSIPSHCWKSVIVSANHLHHRAFAIEELYTGRMELS